MVGNAKECGGLYYMEDAKVSDLGLFALCNVSSNTKDDILLWHKRMSHPNFQYLFYLFPKLWSNKLVSSFQCESQFESIFIVYQ